MIRMIRPRRPPRALPSWSLALLCATAGAGAPPLAGCDKLSEMLGNKKKWTTLEGTDGRSSIRLPPGWEKTDDLNEEASVQAQHIQRASFLLVITEDKGDFAPYSLKRFSAMVRKNMRGRSQNYRETGPRKLTVNGHEALQYEIRAEVLGFKQRMLHTAVAGARYTHQILLWTHPDHWARQKPLFQKIVESFREREGAPRRRGPRATTIALKKVTARSGRATLRIPQGWKELTELNAKADLRHGTQKQNRYVMLITEPRARVPEMALPGYAKIVFEQMSKRLQGFQKEKNREVKVGDRPAVQAVVRGQAGGIRLVYLITLLRSASHYHQLILWTLPSQWADLEPLFERITQSLRVTPASEGSRPRP